MQLTDTADRMTEIEGRKAIVLISSGIDTFSKLTFDKTRKMLQNAGVSHLRDRTDAGASRDTTTPAAPWARSRGWTSCRPTTRCARSRRRPAGRRSSRASTASFPASSARSQDSLRNQYSLTYHPSNTRATASIRKIKVELVNPATGEPLRIVDEKGKPMNTRRR